MKNLIFKTGLLISLLFSGAFCAFSSSFDHLAPVSGVKNILRNFSAERTLGSDPTEDFYFSVMDRTEGKEEGIFLKDKRPLTKILTYLKEGKITGNKVKGLSVSGVWLQSGYLTNAEEDYSLRIDKSAFAEDDFIPETETGGLFNWSVAYGSVDLRGSSRIQIIARTPESMKTLLQSGQREKIFSVVAQSSKEAVLKIGNNYYSLVTQEYFNQMIYKQVMDKANRIEADYLFSGSDLRRDYEQYMFWDSLKKHFLETVRPFEILKSFLLAFPAFKKSA